MSQNFNYEIVLKVKVFNTANYNYVVEKIKELTNEDDYFHDYAKIEIKGVKEEWLSQDANDVREQIKNCCYVEKTAND